MSKPIPVGWPRTPVRWRVRQGGTGTVRVTLTITDAAGDPLDSYDGFTAALAFARGARRSAEVSIEPTVTAAPDNQQIVIDVPFVSGDTAGVTDGELRGDLLVIDPAGGRHYPLDITLTVERRFTP